MLRCRFSTSALTPSVASTASRLTPRRSLAICGAFEALVIGDPADPATDVGPVIDADAKRIEKQVERYHPVPDNLPEGEPNSLASIGPSTKLQGTKFLTQAGANAEDAIIKFLTIHVAKKEFPWSERSLG